MINVTLETVDGCTYSLASLDNDAVHYLGKAFYVTADSTAVYVVVEGTSLKALSPIDEDVLKTVETKYFEARGY